MDFLVPIQIPPGYPLSIPTEICLAIGSLMIHFGIPVQILLEIVAENSLGMYARMIHTSSSGVPLEIAPYVPPAFLFPEFSPYSTRVSSGILTETSSDNSIMILPGITAGIFLLRISLGISSKIAIKTPSEITQRTIRRFLQ